MTYSFIGMGKPLAAFNNSLKLRIREYKNSHGGALPLLTPGGIYASDISRAALFAGENDLCLYTSVDDLLIKSDIIFLFLSDKALRSISLTLGKYPVKGKIFCHFNTAYDAGIMDFTSQNTYISMHIPIYNESQGVAEFNHIISQGYGKLIKDTEYAFGELGIKCTFINEEEKLLYNMALSISSDMEQLLKQSAARMLRYSLATDKELCNKITEHIYENSNMLNSYNAVENMDYELVKKQCSLLKSIGMDKLSNVYASLVDLNTDGVNNTEQASRISKLAKRTFKTEAL